MSTEELLAVAEEAARAAGDELVARFGGERVGVEAKSTPTDLVSEADLAAERVIRSVLAARVPDDGIVGEEGDDVPSRSGRRWIVDPLDGTINFLFGHPQWSVSVACEGEAGVVLDPLRGELFRGGRGVATTLDGAPVRASAREDLATALVATGFGYDAEQRAEQGAVVAELVGRCRDVRRAGSAALDLAWCAAGRVDAYFEHGVQRWDTAAGLLLCEGAGLEACPLRARGWLPAGVLVAPPALVAPLAAIVDGPG